ncbi:MAG: hypothetical protein PUI84_01055 [Bacteroidales bacterium]|nr:hypothetical protein [Porphyromonas sp.]MDD6933899.1 hypothetical protein [Bacteroidales bacterium]MDY3102940.1 hypothetical protein [Porphyromonas sp.]
MTQRLYLDNAPSRSDEEIISSLRARVRSRMDGVTAAAMRTSGVDYAYNFGLSIPQLRELAQSIPPRKSLAEKLLSGKLREMRILGLMVYPATELSQTALYDLAQTLDTEELRNLFAFHLLAAIPHLATWFPLHESLLLQRIWLAALTRQLTLHPHTPQMEEIIQATEKRLTDAPETLSSIEVAFLERLLESDLYHPTISLLLEQWQKEPEGSPLNNVASFLL